MFHVERAGGGGVGHAPFEAVGEVSELGERGEAGGLIREQPSTVAGDPGAGAVGVDVDVGFADVFAGPRIQGVPGRERVRRRGVAVAVVGDLERDVCLVFAGEFEADVAVQVEPVVVGDGARPGDDAREDEVDTGGRHFDGDAGPFGGVGALLGQVLPGGPADVGVEVGPVGVEDREAEPGAAQVRPVEAVEPAPRRERVGVRERGGVDADEADGDGVDEVVVRVGGELGPHEHRRGTGVPAFDDLGVAGVGWVDREPGAGVEDPPAIQRILRVDVQQVRARPRPDLATQVPARPLPGDGELVVIDTR